MSRHKCTKELYKAFLHASSIRYSGLALLEVALIGLSHDSISRRLRDRHFQPKDIWENSKSYINQEEARVLIADDAILSKLGDSKIF